MPTDDERREVARRMRDAMRRKCDFCAHNVAIEMGMADPPDYDGPFNAYHMLAWKSLADLIEPSEPEVRCVAEGKIDGERLDEAVRRAMAEHAGIERDALIALAVECRMFSAMYKEMAPEAESKDLKELFTGLAKRELKIARIITKALEVRDADL